jgi:eukaryotic-like serine/threonine-protein kinase
MKPNRDAASAGRRGRSVTEPIRVGHYELLEPIGEGGMGIVYRARDPRLERIVAIKFLAGAASLDPGRRARFLREARAEAALAHPNIATVLDVGETEIDLPQVAPTSGGWGEPVLPRLPYLVLEYVPGSDLRTRLRKGALPPVEALRIARQIAAGLAAAHAAGIVHRDLKPGNVRLTPEGLVKILDFGLARFLDPQSPSADEATELATREGVVLGTLPYMAPEQAAGQPVDARADLFALGVMLFEMVAGKRPFRGETTMALLRAVLSDPAEELDPAAVGCSPRYAALVDRLLAKEPGDRPGSAREVLSALDEIARDHEQQRTSVGRMSSLSLEISRAVARGRRSPRAMLVAGALLGLVVAAGLFVLPRLRSAPAVPAAAPAVSLQQLAVLPFANATGDPELDYVAEGLGSAIVGQLAAVPGMSVAGQSETRKYRHGSASAREVARELGVGAVLEATLREDVRSMVLDATITDGSTGRVIWSRAFVSPLDELPRLSAQLTESATAALSVPLSVADRERLARDPTGSAVAFDFYLRARAALDDLEDPQSSRIAAGLFERAAQLDPQFALAYAGAAQALVQAWQQERDPGLLARAEERAQRALELDDKLPESRLATADIMILRSRPEEAVRLLEPLAAGDRATDQVHLALSAAWKAAGDAEKSEAHMLSAIAARPGSWTVWNRLGGMRTETGDYRGARQAFERAADLAPPGTKTVAENLAALLLYEGKQADALAAYEAIPGPLTGATSASNLATLYFFNGRYTDAERLFRDAVRLEPRVARWRRNLADTLLRIGKTEEARDEYAQALRLVEEQLAVAPGDSDLKVQRVLYLARADRCAEALAAADALESELARSAQLLHDLARAPALCDRPQQAIERLRAAVSLGFTAASLATEDELATLRGRRDFEALVRSGDG